MQKPFTLEDLANYSLEVYLETHRSVRKAIEGARPSNLAVRNILQYSRALRVSDPGPGGPVFLIMN